MREEEFKILNRINRYADLVLKGMDLEKTPISVQLDKLKPEMELIAKEQNLSVEEVFILYMDLNLQNQKEEEEKLKRKMEGI